MTNEFIQGENRGFEIAKERVLKIIENTEFDCMGCYQCRFDADGNCNSESFKEQLQQKIKEIK